MGWGVWTVGAEVVISMHRHVALLGSLMGFFPRTFAFWASLQFYRLWLNEPAFSLNRPRYGWGHLKRCCVPCRFVSSWWHLQCAEPGGSQHHLAWEVQAGLGRTHRLEVHSSLVKSKRWEPSGRKQETQTASYEVRPWDNRMLRKTTDLILCVFVFLFILLIEAGTC